MPDLLLNKSKHDIVNGALWVAAVACQCDAKF